MVGWLAGWAGWLGGRARGHAVGTVVAAAPAVAMRITRTTFAAASMSHQNSTLHTGPLWRR